MATVYLARDVKHGRTVAVKVLRSELSEALGAERFLREIEIVAGLHHPQILPLYDSGEAEGFLYYVMPFVEGESLRDLIERETQLSIEDALRIAREVAEGLSYAHSYGVVHRDIKPENILLSGGHAVVADFGIARAMTEAGGTKLTETGIVVGTPTYMSPEQGTGVGKIDGRADVYAMGCVLYEMLAGEPPFSGPTPVAIIARHSLESIPSVRIVRPTVSASIEHTINRAMAKIPADRFATAAQFAEALEESGAVDYASGAMPSRPRPRSRARLGVVMAASVVVAGVAAAAALALRSEPEVPLDRDLVAVAPIAVLDESFEAWSDGMGDFLSRTLDGAGPLRTIPPTTVGERAPRRLDAGSATALGRSIGAGLVVFGSLMPLRGDSVRANVTVVDAATEDVIGDLEVRDAAARMDQVLDSVAVGVLRQLGARGRVGAFPLWSLGSTSMTALKAFLRGEYAFRRTDWDSARVYYEQALALDSGIVMAQFRLGFVYSLGEGDAGRAYAQFHRAGELNRGMSEHDSLIIESAAKMAALKLGLVPDSLEEDDVDDGFGKALRAATRFPEDAEAWYMVGLHRDYQHERINSTPATTLEAYLRAVALDSGFGPVYQRAAQIALVDGQLDVAQQLAAQYLALDPPTREMGKMLVIAKLLDPTVSEAEAESLLDSLPDEVLTDAFNGLMGIADSGEAVIRIAREGYSRPHDQRFFYTTDWVLRRSLAGMLAYRGHLREAYELTGTEEESWFPTIFAELAVWGHVPAEIADSTIQAWLTADPYYPRFGIAFAHWWLAARGDTAAIQTIIRKNPDVARELSPYLALARRDTSEALQRFTELRDAEEMGFWDPLALSRLLVAEGRDAEALEVLKDPYTSQWPVPTRGYWALERARLADRLGDRETAIDSYQFVADVWRNSDEELQSHVTEAREALRRLTVEPEGT